MILTHTRNPSTVLAAIERALPKPSNWRDDRRYWIAGGAPRRALQGAAIVNDIDLFFTGSKSFDAFTDSAFFLPGAKLKAEKPHALEIQINIEISGKPEPFLLQCVRHQFFIDVHDLLSDFDYTICQFALDDGMIYYPLQALEDLNDRRLRAANISMPTAAFRRLIKYREQGFRADDETIRAILRAAAANPSSIDKEVVLSDGHASLTPSAFTPAFIAAAAAQA
jgi:hypothetical protein